MKKIVFSDLDGTLILPKSGNTFPMFIGDMDLRIAVIKKIVDEFKPEAIVIVSNQGGIEKGFVGTEYFESKINFVVNAIEEFCIRILKHECKVFGMFCPYNNPDNDYRKPNVGMLKLANEKLGNPAKSDCIMLGDMDTDKKTAENFGIEYVDVNDLLKQ